MRVTPNKSGALLEGGGRKSSTWTLISGLFVILFIAVIGLNIMHITGVNDVAEPAVMVKDTSLGATPAAAKDGSANTAALSAEQAEHIKELRSKISDQKHELAALYTVRGKVKERAQQLQQQATQQEQQEMQAKLLRRQKQKQEESDHQQEELRQERQRADSAAAPGGPHSQANVKISNPDVPGRADLPGAVSSGRHAILLMSDVEFRNTPVSEMLNKYGQARGGGSCEGDFGAKLANRWRATKQTVCQGAEVVGAQSADMGKPAINPYTHVPIGRTKRRQNAAGGISSSSTECFLVRQTRHHGNGDNLCHYKDVSVNMALFDDENVVMPVVQNYVNTRHNKQPYIPFPKGFINGKCLPLPNQGWAESQMPGWNTDLTVKAFKSHAYSEQESNDLKCDEWVDHKVIMLQRDTFANFFHDSEDFVNLFLALAILKWSPGDTQVYLTDLYPEGPFWELWSEAFGWGKGNMPKDHSDSSNVFTNDKSLPVRTAFHLKQDFGTVTGKNSASKGKTAQHAGDVSPNVTGGADSSAAGIDTPPNKGPVRPHHVCYRDLAVGIYGPASPITVASWMTPCSDTALVRAYADYMIRGLNLQAFTHYAQEKPKREIVITYMARRASTVWPEKRFCDDKKSFFLCKLWDKFGIRPLQRMIRNDEEVVKAIKGMEGGTYANGAKVIFNDRDFNLLHIRDQVKEDLRTDILIGPHGAGLMHCVFLRERAVVIELTIDGSGANKHFYNLAKWSGHRYISGPSENPVQVGRLVQLIKSTVESININAY